MLVFVLSRNFQANIMNVSFHTSRFIFNRSEFNIAIPHKMSCSSFLNVSNKSLLSVGLYYQCTILTSCFSSESTYLTKAEKKKKGNNSISMFHIPQTTHKVKNCLPECASLPTKSQKQATETKIHYKIGHDVTLALEYSKKWLGKDIASLLSAEGKYCELWEEEQESTTCHFKKDEIRSTTGQNLNWFSRCLSKDYL